MPTIPASAGTSFGYHGKKASLPRTKKTVSPTPAPIESSATSARPTAAPSAPIGCTTSSVMPSRFGSLRVMTTSPMTFASCTSVAGGDLHRVDDADDGRVHGAVLQAGGHAGGAAADDEHGFADA